MRHADPSDFGRHALVFGAALFALLISSHALAATLTGTITSVDLGFNVDFRNAAIGSDFTLSLNLSPNKSFLDEAPVTSFAMGGYTTNTPKNGSGFVSLFEQGGNLAVSLSLPAGGDGVPQSSSSIFPLRPDRIFVSLVREGFSPGDADSVLPSTLSGNILNGTFEFRFSAPQGGGTTFQSVFGTLDTGPTSPIPLPASLFLLLPAVGLLGRLRRSYSLAGRHLAVNRRD